MADTEDVREKQSRHQLGLRRGLVKDPKRTLTRDEKEQATVRSRKQEHQSKLRGRT